ncbi:MAG: hypothetical protein Q9190_005550 [Brigantiaea leucoxantha]
MERERLVRELAAKNPYLNVPKPTLQNAQVGPCIGYGLSKNPSPVQTAHDVERQRQLYGTMRLQKAHHASFSHPPSSLSSSGHQTPNIQSHSASVFIPPLSEVSLSNRQREARDQIVSLGRLKRKVINERKKLWEQISCLEEEIQQLYDTQCKMENLKFIYPKEAELGRAQATHTEFGRLWEQACDNLEFMWGEMMVEDDENGQARIR